MIKKHTAEWWDRFWSSDIGDFGKPRSELLSYAKQALAGSNRECTAVDVGSGNGRYAIPLARLGFCVTAVDNSLAACNLIRKRIAEEGIATGMLEVLRDDFSKSITILEGRKFGFVLSSGLIEEVLLNRQIQTITNLQKLVDPEGILILKFCLEISDRGITVPAGRAIRLFENENWRIIEHEIDADLRPSIATISFENRIQTETIIAQNVRRAI